MITTAFSYHKAGTVADALKLLAECGDDAKILAGGHSLIPAMKLRLNQPEHLIDISGISEIRYIRCEGNSLRVGAGATHADIANSSDVQSHMPMLAETAALIGDPAVRNKGTMGGVLAHADPAADYPAALLAADAEVVVQGPGGERIIALENFLLGLFDTDLAENEIIVEVRMNISPSNAKSTYQKFMQPASRYAIVGCAAMVTVDQGRISDAKVAFSSVAEKAFRAREVENALKGQEASEATIKAAVKNAVNGVEVLSDHFASSEYRGHLAKVYAERALKAVI
ncbi:MAG: xanthine dehydrogenase family protein subunit M [Bacteroidia bacterium]|nr:xanthine dehydrogenase family protein subunit M [Bacteroidia bacterium]